MKRASFNWRAGGGFAALAFAISLGGCDQIRQMTGQDQPAANAVAANSSAPAPGSAPSLSAPAGSAVPARPAGPADPALEAEVAQAARDLQAELPMQVEPGTTVVALSADGTEFVYDVTIGRSIAPAQIELLQRTLQASNQATLCANADTAAFIRRGGSMYYRYTDAAGNRFETRVVSCS